MQNKLKRILLDHLSILRVKRGQESMLKKVKMDKLDFYDNKIKEVEEIIKEMEAK